MPRSARVGREGTAEDDPMGKERTGHVVEGLTDLSE